MKKPFVSFLCTTLSFLLVTQVYAPISLATVDNIVTICKCDPINPEIYHTLQCANDELRRHLDQGASLGSCDDLGSLVTICYVGANYTGPVTIDVPQDLLRNFLWKGAELGACKDGKITICHVPPGNPDAAHTLEIDSNGLNGHIPNHSLDYVGECRGSDCTKVKICKVARDGRGASSEIEVCSADLASHLDDGDYLGSCENGRSKITLCHKDPLTTPTVTIQVNTCAVRKYLDNRDQLGPCPPGPNPVCGNRIIEDGEECDDGAETDRCNRDCTLSVCGDGKLNPSAGELCDDGNQSNNDGCLNTCVPAGCGDGYVWTGHEQCDDAGWSLRCNNDCTLSRCGDRLVNLFAGEQCDFGNNTINNGCSVACARLNICGNGLIEPGEQCDNGTANSNIGSCLPNCELNVCGDGFLNQGVEQCDDGNQNNLDSCKNDCSLNVCGDGYVYAGVEQCDDGNQDNNDQCLNNCNIAYCGDGYVRTGIEQCDDGNTVNTDLCLNTCQNNVCHDGFQSPLEQCDDGNYLNTDGCIGNCIKATCGDGFVWHGVEACDQGPQNGAGLGFCLSDCSGISGAPSNITDPGTGGGNNIGLIVGLTVGIPALMLAAGMAGFFLNAFGFSTAAGHYAGQAAGDATQQGGV